MSKGSKRRPAAIDERTWAERWSAINWNVDNDDAADPAEGDIPERSDNRDGMPSVLRGWD